MKTAANNTLWDRICYLHEFICERIQTYDNGRYAFLIEGLTIDDTLFIFIDSFDAYWLSNFFQLFNTRKYFKEFFGSH